MHRARTTKKYLADNAVRLFWGDRWPPNSPDMNPIEHLWPMVTKQLSGKVFAGREALCAGGLCFHTRCASVVSFHALAPGSPEAGQGGGGTLATECLFWCYNVCQTPTSRCGPICGFSMRPMLPHHRKVRGKIGGVVRKVMLSNRTKSYAPYCRTESFPVAHSRWRACGAPH